MPNSPKNTVEIAQRIFGDGQYSNKGLIQSLASESRGVLGWYDLMLFRLQCSADRQGQIYNVHSALIVYSDMNAPTTGQVSEIAINGMRVLSQRIYQQFRETYMDSKRNFFDEVDKTSDSDFYGKMEVEAGNQQSAEQLLAARTTVKSFVIYQLANCYKPTGSGVGCGLYDESGTIDSGGISTAMNKYIFDYCFNPLIKEENIFNFANYCLYNLSNGFWTEANEEGYVPTETGLTSGLNLAALTQYWAKIGDRIKELNLQKLDRQVVTQNYITSYTKDLSKVFDVLDGMTTKTAAASTRS